MSRNTINFGIDLGTTNSEIAWMNDNGEVVIFKNYLQSEFTPSVVRIDERGTVTVGRKAFERLFDDPDNKRICDFINRFYKKFNKYPSAQELITALPSNTRERTKLLMINSVTLPTMDRDFTIAMVESFFRD